MKNKSEVDKNIRLYSKYYRILLFNEGIKDTDGRQMTAL